MNFALHYDEKARHKDAFKVVQACANAQPSSRSNDECMTVSFEFERVKGQMELGAIQSKALASYIRTLAVT